MCKLTQVAPYLILSLFATLTGCAGSAPDYSQRTAGAPVKQNQLTSWLEADSVANRDSMQIAAPVCSTDAGHPPEGWAIDKGSWCVVACPVSPPDGVYDRWLRTHDGLRCYATKNSGAQLVTTQLDRNLWNLDSQVLFEGFDRSFVSDTQWDCEEQEYRVDPDSKQGFWVPVDKPGNTYSFYNDGALMVGRRGFPMKFAGDWRGGQRNGFSSGVVVNDEEVFRFAVNYGGGRFDEFRSATEKQVCRFKDHPGPRI